LFGVTPFGVVVVGVVLLPQAGASKSAPLITKTASSPEAFRNGLPPTTEPRLTSESIGTRSQSAGNPRGCATAPVVTGPNVLIVIVELTAVPLTGKLVIPEGYENEHTGGMVTSGVTVEQDNVTPPFGNPGLMYPLMGLIWTTPCPPLPALTLLGDTALVTVMVNCCVTDNTVRF